MTSKLFLAFLLWLLRDGWAAPTVQWPCNALTWNVNGASKFRNLHPEQQYLASFDVVFLQETFSTDDVLPYELDGFIAYHTPARYTTRRPQWGMTTLLKITSFVGGRLCMLPTPCEWIQSCRWARPSGLGVIFLNVYVPVHTRGTTVTDIGHLATLFEDLAVSFPGDVILCGGDLNVDRWRLAEQVADGRPPSSLVRYFLLEDVYLLFLFRGYT